MIDLRCGCGSECDLFIHKWAIWWEVRRPNAFLPIMDLNAYSYGRIDAKGRNMVRKAIGSGYEYGSFVFNDRLEEMDEINNSLEFRSGGKMLDSYHTTDPIIVDYDCPKHTQLYIGCFKDSKLVAYSWLAVCGELGIINRFIGHGDHLKYGIMNGLVQAILFYGNALAPSLRLINYLHVHPTAPGNDRFKRSVGFKPLIEHVSTL